MTEKRTHRLVIKWAVALAIFAVLGKMVWENWDQLKEASFAFRLVPFLLSSLLFVLSYFIQVWAWHFITVRLGIALAPGETVANWFYSQMGKYLPGKVWLLLGRFYLYDSKGKPRKAITIALYLETVTLILAAGLVFLLSLLPPNGVRLLPIGIPLPGVVFLLLLSLFLLHPRVLEKIFNAVLVRLNKEPFPLSFSYADVLWILTVCVLSWIVGGFGFYLFVDSVFAVSPKDVFLLTGALAISSTAGLLALFAPSGLGVREGVLVLLLSSIMPSSVAVVLSILTRLWMTFIEIGLIGVVYLIHSLRRRG